MATEKEAKVVYAAGLVQGIVLVTFPAASTIFTDPGQYDLSRTQYGTMFLPQVVTAIIASLLGGRLARRLGSKRVYLVGLYRATPGPRSRSDLALPAPLRSRFPPLVHPTRPCSPQGLGKVRACLAGVGRVSDPS